MRAGLLGRDPSPLHEGMTSFCLSIPIFLKVVACARVKLLQLHPAVSVPWAGAHQALLSMGFSRQEYRSDLPLPSAGDLPNPGIEPVSLMFPALADGFLCHEGHLGSL